MDRSATASDATPVLELQNVSKRFGGIAALSSASLTLPPKTTLALVGENGAGKSTLIKIVSGVIRPDGGAVLVDGAEVDFRSPGDASVQGIATVYQELSLLPEMSVAENLVLGSYPASGGLISWRRARKEAHALLEELGLPLSVNAPVSRLSLAERYLVEIAKAMRHRPRVLILDEPTAALDPHDSEKIFALMDGLRDSGTSMIFVSHRLDELFRTSQTFMVMKDGRTVDAGSMTGMTSDGLVASMLGRDDRDRVEAQRPAAAPAGVGRSMGDAPVLTVSAAASAAVARVDFDIRPGEIVGVAGLRGSGQTELCRLIAGVDRLTSGRIELRGADFRPKTPADAVRLGVSYLPQERKSEGLFLNLSVAQNVSMAPLVRKSLGWITRARELRLAEGAKRDLDIRLPGGRVTTPVSALSGGNQQKVVLARCLAANPSVLVLDEPTRGVDVGAKAQIHQLIRDQAEKGLSVVVSSSELEELLGLADRILVLHRGEMVADLSGDALSEHAVLAAASGEAA